MDNFEDDQTYCKSKEIIRYKFIPIKFKNYGCKITNP